MEALPYWMGWLLRVLMDGIEVVQALENAGHLARRDEVLKAGCIARGQLLAVLLSGGIDADMKRTFQGQLLEGLWAGALGKDEENIVEIFRRLYALTLDDNPGLVRATLEGFAENTRKFLRA